MVEGGIWRRPGPSLRADDGFDGTGKTSDGKSSPGRTKADMANSSAAQDGFLEECLNEPSLTPARVFIRFAPPLPKFGQRSLL